MRFVFKNEKWQLKNRTTTQIAQRRRKKTIIKYNKATLMTIPTKNWFLSFRAVDIYNMYIEYVYICIAFDTLAVPEIW